jgi:hypothetical protein
MTSKHLPKIESQIKYDMYKAIERLVNFFENISNKVDTKAPTNMQGRWSINNFFYQNLLMKDFTNLADSFDLQSGISQIRMHLQTNYSYEQSFIHGVNRD